MDIITLIDSYARGLVHAEEAFLKHLNMLSTLEETVSELSNKMAADFIGLVLTNKLQLFCPFCKRVV